MNQRQLDILTLLAKTKAEELADGFDLQMAGERVNYATTSETGTQNTGEDTGAGAVESGVTEDITQEEGAAAGLQAILEQAAQMTQAG